MQLSLFLANKNLNHHKDVEKKLDLLETGSVAGVEQLNQAYADVFERNTPQGDIEKGHAVKLYKILLCCKQRLTTVVLAEALAFDENKAELWMNKEFSDRTDIDEEVVDKTVTRAYVLGLCRDFVVEFANGVLDFAHISVKDYLQGEGAGSLPKDHYSMTHCTQQMAKLCLRYFITNKEEPHFKGKYFRMHNFMSYAFKRLGEHCSELNKELRIASGITKNLVDWMVWAKGRNPFTNFLTQVQAVGYRVSSIREWSDDVQSTSNSNSAIFAACAWNLVEVIEQLLVADAECIGRRNKAGSTPLFIACRLGREDIVKLLLNWDSDIEGIGDGSKHYSALHGVRDPAIAELLLTKHPRLVHSVDARGCTPLFGPAGSWKWQTKAVPLVKLYLKYGASVDATDNDGCTALHRPNNPEVTRVLAEKATANARDNKGRTPIDLVDDQGMTALLCAVTSTSREDENKNINAIEALLGLGASILSTNNKSQGVLHLAESPRVVKYLLQGDSTLGSSQPGSPSAHARSRRELIHASLSCVKDQLAATDNNGDTPLLAAARNPESPHKPNTRPFEKLMALIEVGADVNASNKAGQNSLHLIMEDGMLDSDEYHETELKFAAEVQGLVSRGCNIHHEGNDGSQPIHSIFGPEATSTQMCFAKCKLACLVEAGVSITCLDREDKTFIDHFLIYLKRQEQSIQSIRIYIENGSIKSKFIRYVNDALKFKHYWRDQLF